MSVSAEAVQFEGERTWVGLSDGQVTGAPLGWFSRLGRATPAEREAFGISLFGIHWERLGEDVPVQDLFAGRGDRGRVGGEAA